MVLTMTIFTEYINNFLYNWGELSLKNSSVSCDFYTSFHFISPALLAVMLIWKQHFFHVCICIVLKNGVLSWSGKIGIWVSQSFHFLNLKFLWKLHLWYYQARLSAILILRYSPSKGTTSFISYCFSKPTFTHISGSTCSILMGFST